MKYLDLFPDSIQWQQSGFGLPPSSPHLMFSVNEIVHYTKNGEQHNELEYMVLDVAYHGEFKLLLCRLHLLTDGLPDPSTQDFIVEQMHVFRAKYKAGETVPVALCSGATLNAKILEVHGMGRALRYRVQIEPGQRVYNFDLVGYQVDGPDAMVGDLVLIKRKFAGTFKATVMEVELQIVQTAYKVDIKGLWIVDHESCVFRKLE